jgi:outer membrane receptor protein involved in Fe transport
MQREASLLAGTSPYVNFSLQHGQAFYMSSRWTAKTGISGQMVTLRGSKMKNVREFARLGLLASAAMGALVVSSAWAQTASTPPVPAEAAKTPQANDEEIIVTGSRIPRPQFEGSIPGAQVSAVDIQQRAFTNAIEVLNDIPLVGNGAGLNGNNGGQPSSLGAAFVDLLDLGTARTLTLVNGRRFVSGNAASLFVAGNESGGQVDVNVIPATLIKRVDVLTVGGAVAYGSDAVAGVVNYVLLDDYEGGQVRSQVSTTSRGDGLSYNFSGLYGLNFNEKRGNIVLSAEYNKLGGIQADDRRFRVSNPLGITNFANGTARNTGFTPGTAIDVANTNNGAFLRGADDGIPNVIFVDNTRAVNIAPGGAIFNLAGTVTGNVNQVGPFGNTFFAGNTQLLTGTPAGNGRAGGTGTSPVPFTVFAPTALPAGVTAASVISALAPGLNTTGATAAQLTTLAVNLLQANRPTPREFYANNGSVPLNAFVGSFIAAFPDIANTNTSTVTVNGVSIPQNLALPRLAVPIRFNSAGQVEQYNLASLAGGVPSTVGAAIGGDGFNPIFNTVLRVDQKRYIGNLIGHYDLTDDIKFYTENSFARLSARSLRNGASANSAASGTVENAALILNTTNPFLTSQNRRDLAAAGIGTVDANGAVLTASNFVMSRTNQDISGNNGFKSDSDTWRTTNGLTWDFDVVGRDLKWDMSATYGRAKGGVSTFNLKDVEYALAVDTAIDPATGQVVCRSKLTGVPATIAGTGVAGVPSSDTNIRGVAANLVRLPGADGIPTEQIFTPRVTQDLINGCQPLNPFGYDKMSQAAKDYVTGEQRYDNVSSQLFLQTSIGGGLFDLPAGQLGASVFGEYRREKLNFTVDELSLRGRTRTAAIAQTGGTIKAWEAGGELRIPVFGPDFSLPLLQDLSFSGGVRFVQQDGSSPTYRNLAGSLITPTSNGKTNTIWSIAGNWKPIDDITIRGNVTRSIRQPGIVELFLGGQPAFTTPTDPCSTGQITIARDPARRRANCAADVVRLGIQADAASAANFLNTYVPNGTALSGTFSGNNSLKSERGKSWTAGVILQPRVVDNLTVSADYIDLKLNNIVSIVGAAQALFFCYDSATFPDTTAQFGSNACNFFSRSGAGAQAFQLQNGFQSGFLNLAATRVKALNLNFDYKADLDDMFGTEDVGSLRLRSNIYHLIKYDESAAGDFTDTQASAGRTDRPKWEVQGSLEYTNGEFDARWTTNWQNATKVFSAGVPVTIETQSIIGIKSYAVHDFTMGYGLGEDRKVAFRFTVQNVFDKNYVESNLDGAAVGFVDSIGRRLFLTGTVKF